MQDYKVVLIEATDFQDNYGNTWTNVVLEGVGEPVKLVLKDPDSVKNNDTIFGEVETKTSKAGKEYLKFKRGKPEDNPAHQAQEDKRGDAISKSMVVKLAFQAFISSESMLPQEDAHWRQIQYTADMLYKTINAVDSSKIIEPENVLDSIKGDVGNPALRKGLKKTGHDFGVADEKTDLNDIFGEDDDS